MTKLQEWWRGWSEADLESLSNKIEASKTKPPGSMTALSPREMRAMREYLRRNRMERAA